MKGEERKMNKNKALFVYDNTGKIYHWAVGSDIKAPEGLPYIILDNYESDGRIVEKIDITQNPPVLIYSKTEDELAYEAMTLEEYKELRQNENKVKLAEFLKKNPILWADGMYYGVTQEDQNEMNLDLSTYQLKKSLGDLGWKLQWHSIKSDCRNFTEEEFLGLLEAIIEFVYPYRQLEMKYKEAIYSATTKEVVAAVNISYELGAVISNE